VYLNSTVNCWS